MDDIDNYLQYTIRDRDLLYFEESSFRIQPPPMYPPEREPEENLIDNQIGKTKKIQKEEKTERKRGKAPQKVSEVQSFGRPPNGEIEKEHLKESREYNDIIYHYARLLILLKLRQGEDSSIHLLQIQNQESQWMSQTEQIMKIDTFPRFEDIKKPRFLLHSNSLHFVFKYLKEHNNKRKYGAEELKFMFLAFLKKRNIFSTDTYHYVVDYWPDILYLVNHPDGDELSDSEQEENETEKEMKLEAEPQEGEKVSGEIALEDFEEVQPQSQKSGSSSPPKKRKSNKGNSQLDKLRKELNEDDSIIAYQIACYLHSCLKKFRLMMSQSK